VHNEAVLSAPIHAWGFGIVLRIGSLNPLVVIGDAEHCVGKPVTERLVILELLKKLSVVSEQGRDHSF
jgi:hypothetical protein